MEPHPTSVADCSPLLAIDDDPPASPDEARELLDACLQRFVEQVCPLARASIESTDDLFELNAQVGGDDVQLFRDRRPHWVGRFESLLRELVQRRLGGTRRKGRRADSDVSIATLRILSAYDQEMQSAITRAAEALAATARRELDALDQRVGLLLGEKAQDGTDNPFGVAYLLDAIGATSRGLYANPHVWRPLMQRLLVDLRPGIARCYITLNRLLADRGVLPEIKAALRARSALRPASDSDLFPVFERMLKELPPPGAATVAATGFNIAVPSVEELTSGRKAAVGVDAGARRTTAAPTPGHLVAREPGTVTDARSAGTTPGALPDAIAPALASAFYAAYASYVEHAAQPSSGKATAAADPGLAMADGLALPEVDSTLALGPLRDAIVELDHWQRFDPEAELAATGAQPIAADSFPLPLNRLPLIRNAIAAKFANPSDRISLDVVALLFDYIFRDRSIPESQRRIFARLQVPVAKAALLDRRFFSDRQHPARRLLDDLAAAAVGAHADPGYQQEFATLADAVVSDVCADFAVNVATFETAAAKLRPFVDSRHDAEADAARQGIGEALASEDSEGDRVQVRVLLRDRLAGLELPFAVRSFLETGWADHLTALHTAHGSGSEAWKAGVATLDDLLWSIAAKERSAQKAKLTKLIPNLLARLRAGIATQPAAGERARAFFDSLYRLHIAVLRPTPAVVAAAPASAGTAAGTASTAVQATTEMPGLPPAGTAGDGKPFDGQTVHDFVSEMAVGTWVLFKGTRRELPARLFWVSPRRTRYVFTTRARTKALSMTPEELAWRFNAGRATLIVEPVPLFDRAVSAALDTLAARAPQPRKAA